MHPRQQQAVAVEQGFARPIRLVVVAHPMRWVADQVGSKNLHLAYYLVGSILVGELVAPDVANLKMQRHLPFSFSRYCGRASAQLPE